MASVGIKPNSQRPLPQPTGLKESLTNFTAPDTLKQSQIFFVHAITHQSAYDSVRRIYSILGMWS